MSEYMAKHVALLKILFGLPAFLIILAIGSTGVAAQNRMVTGKIISSEDELEIPGVNILVKGTSIGTSTDINGMYSIEVPTGSSVLVFSFIGYQTQEVEIGSRSVLHITLTPEAGQLGEVVVTALGIRREEISLGYSIGRIGGDELNRVVQENVLNGMAGKVAGVTVD